MNHLLLLACHTNSLIKKKVLLNNIPYFNELCNNMVIIQSSECKNDALEQHIKQINKNIEFFYTDNDKYLCQGKWSYYLNTIDYNKYDYITLTNDSFLITKSLNNYKKLFDKNIEVVGLLDSYECKHHIPDFLRTYNKVGIKKILNHYSINKNKINNYSDVVNEYEVNSSSLFHTFKILYPMNKSYLKNIHFDDTMLKNYLYNLNYPVIKIKKLLINKYPQNFKIPNNFNAEEYRSLNGDISHFNDLELTTHFIKHGIKDGRLYKQSQEYILPQYLSEYLKRNQLLDNNEIKEIPKQTNIQKNIQKNKKLLLQKNKQKILQLKMLQIRQRINKLNLKRRYSMNTLFSRNNFYY